MIRGRPTCTLFPVTAVFRCGVDLEAVVRGLRVEDLDPGGEPARLHAACDVDRVVAVGAVDDDAVGLAVAGGAAEGVGEVDGHAWDAGAVQAADGHLVRSLAG